MAVVHVEGSMQARIIGTLDMKGWLVHCCACDLWVWESMVTQAEKVKDEHNKKEHHEKDGGTHVLVKLANKKGK